MNIREFAEKVFAENPTRFRKEEKERLLSQTKSFLTENGWGSDEIRIQKFKGSIKSQNLIIGDPKSAEYIVTAHYDTPGRTGFLLATSKLFGQTGANIVMMLSMLPFCILCGYFGGRNAFTWQGIDLTFLSIYGLMVLFLLVMLIPMFIKNKNNRNDNTSGVIAVLNAAVKAAADPELSGKCCFVLFDNEEWGLIGSKQFAGWCRNNGINLDEKTAINIDCVGLGEYLCAARTNSDKTERQTAFIENLKSTGIEIVEKQSSMIYLSDHANLKNSFMLTYMEKSKTGPLFIPNIHTGKDTVCDVEKVIDLSDKVIKAIKL